MDDDDVWQVTWEDHDGEDTMKTADKLARDDSAEGRDEAIGRWVIFAA